MLLRFFFKQSILFSMCVFLSACALQTSRSLTDHKIHDLWRNHQQQLKRIKHFSVSGSVAYFSIKNRSYAGFYLNQQNDKEYELILSTPLGSPVMTLHVTQQKASLTLADGRTYSRKKVDTLLQDATGLPIPLTSLHNWLIGLSNDTRNDLLNEEGYLKETRISTENGDWHLAITRYHKTLSPSLPEKIELTHQHDRIKLTLKTWTL